ncbi:uncharacterized protein isoform X2 [Choristoneura fumiferana]|uniref:uncharacterized protein isoform X2 n=1 Tax=Choristoneura fumiferana TaxID=7141 RepID=UPI003D158AF8
MCHKKEEDMYVGKIITVVVIMLLSTQSVQADCTLNGDYDGRLCVGNYTCYYTIDDPASEIRHWGCRERLISFGEYRRTHTMDYVLNIRINSLLFGYNYYTNILEYSDHIITISANKGTWMTIPNELFDLTQLLSLDVSHNHINMFDSSRIHVLEKLVVFNASFNSISELQKDSEIDSQLSVIDLSHNAISVIPDNYFKNFPNLIHLNMSHNEIKTFSILTFEGVADLETLHLSNNKIEKIGMYFARFQNLKELSLDYNELSFIDETSFKIMSKLVKLNLSFNKIISFDDSCFQSMIGLEKLQLNDNMIKMVSKSMFINNNKLQILDLSGNNITVIESYTFKGKYITQLSLNDNSITGLLDKSILAGINADTFDFSGNNISSLGPDLFTDSHLQLRLLNFSMNSISEIHYNTFRTLGFLVSLDLSNNRLQNLQFDFSDLNSLAIFEARNNLIEKITKDTFKHVKSLQHIDLSNNLITDIDIFSFKGLEHLFELDLSNNHLSSIIATNTFSGLSATRFLKLKYSKITTIEDGAFYGLTSLMYLNMSHGDLQVLNFNVFNYTGSIWTLDLSHNKIEAFQVNNSDLQYLTDLQLNNNQIEIITNQTFTGLKRLQQLNLNNNNIQRIDSGALNNLFSLSNLILSSNVDMVLDSSIFLNSSLTEVSIHNVWKPFDFANAKNLSILNLDLSSCNITDIGTLRLVKVEKLKKLLLNSNKIRIIDKNSFQNLSDLFFLDLSDNLITSITPGSFVSAKDIDVLNLSNNNLQSLQFGIFDGLASLNVLDLSRNSLHSFNGNIFHNSHRISVIYLDNNMLDTIDLNEISSAGIPEISIGYNLISCDFLVKSKKRGFFGVVVTTEIKEFHSENVDGISCKGSNFDDNQQNNYTEKLTKATNSEQVPYSGSFNSQIIVNKLSDLKSVLYFEASCLLIVVVLLVTVVSFVYNKSRGKLVRSYSLNSRRHLTGSAMEMEL